MASLGLNVDRSGRHDPALIRSLGATWVRIVATPEHDLTDYFRRCRDAGLQILLVLARESGGDYAALATRYATLVDAWQVGNEADLTSDSSWTMSQVELAALGRAVRAILPRPHVLVCAGLASGHPSWLDGMDLSPFDALAFHPYMKDAPNPEDLEDQPDVTELLEGYQRFGLPLLVTEWGWPSDQEPRASEEVVDMAFWAGTSDQIEAFFYFCADDAMVPPFGLLDAQGREKPKAKAFKRQAALAVHSLWPDVREEPTEPEPEPEPAFNPWEWWTAEQIAAAAQCPLSAVRENWPRLVEQMTHAGIYDRMVAIGMIGTIAKESASTFRPVREAYYLGEPEPAESHRRTLRYYPYYGRGFIQNTWRDSYAELGPKIAALWGTDPNHPDFDFVRNPDKLLDPDFSAAAAAIFFRDKAGGLLLAAARSGNWADVRLYVLGGPDHEGTQRIGRIAQQLGTTTPDPIDDKDEQIAALTLALKTLRDRTLPDLRAQLDEADRICRQFVGST